MCVCASLACVFMCVLALCEMFCVCVNKHENNNNKKKTGGININ